MCRNLTARCVSSTLVARHSGWLWARSSDTARSAPGPQDRYEGNTRMTETDETERGWERDGAEESRLDPWEYPATETVQLALNGRLTVTLVALNLSPDPYRWATPSKDDPNHPYPFVPYRAKRSLGGAQSGDIGLGKPALQAVVTRTVDSTGDEVIFGRSVGTALEPFRSTAPGQPGMIEAMMCTSSEICDAMRDSDDEIQIYQGPPRTAYRCGALCPRGSRCWPSSSSKGRRTPSR